MTYASSSGRGAGLANRKADFPLLRDSELGHALHFLNDTATTEKPEPVIAALSE